MRKIALNMNMTLDGFFNLDWMEHMPLPPDQELLADTLAQISTTNTSAGSIAGYSFYRGMVPFWSAMETNPQVSETERAIARAVNVNRRIVISKTEAKLEGENAELLVARNDQELLAAIQDLKQQEGPDMAVIGGIRTARAFVRLGLIDVFTFQVYPVAIGKGERIFTSRVDLELIGMKTYPSGVMRVSYRPRAK
uniref:Bacterial bifunctional deaminase-reductase C-terminal domain-containing protein n=1 Tax=Thermosporothrix sp. COM3 TaxID=2490863 RepID=A0A455SKI2_9CHLR|nr:hypothetical protein KTC_21630 [Thermosporothrix sp. COM3]